MTDDERSYNTQNLAKFIAFLTLSNPSIWFTTSHHALSYSALHSRPPSTGRKIWLMTKKLFAVAERMLNIIISNHLLFSFFIRVNIFIVFNVVCVRGSQTHLHIQSANHFRKKNIFHGSTQKFFLVHGCRFRIVSVGRIRIFLW